MHEPVEPVDPSHQALHAQRRGLDAQQRVALALLLVLVFVLLLDGARVYSEPPAEALAPQLLPVMQAPPASAASAPRMLQAQA